MRAMTAHICQPDVATTLASLMRGEIDANRADVPNYVHDWRPSDIQTELAVLATEENVIRNCVSLRESKDSVKGEEAMRAVYSLPIQQKATDVITRKATGSLALTEIKYLVKLASTGPFGGRGSFRERVSGKFNAMAKVMEPDGEALDPLRILVVTEEQYPYSVNHIRALVDGDYPLGTFSDDGFRHEYVLCTSANLRMVIDNSLSRAAGSSQCFYFSL